MKTKIPWLILCALLLQPADAEEPEKAPEKVMIELQRVVVDATAAQRRSAVFAILESNGMAPPRSREGAVNQIIVSLTHPGIARTDVAARNVLAIIQLFPAEHDDRPSDFRLDRVSKPKGRLVFRVPREHPEDRLAEWEIDSRWSRFLPATGYGE